jgi:hypothetical protein
MTVAASAMAEKKTVEQHIGFFGEDLSCWRKTLCFGKLPMVRLPLFHGVRHRMG